MIKRAYKRTKAKNCDAKNRACPAREICQELHVTETDHCHWSVANRLNVYFLKYELVLMYLLTYYN